MAAKAGQQGKRIQEEVVCNGAVELGQVQADELFVKMQNGKVWMATAMSVFSRLFIWGEVSPRRDKVAQATKDTTQPVPVAVDGGALCAGAGEYEPFVGRYECPPAGR